MAKCVIQLLMPAYDPKGGEAWSYVATSRAQFAANAREATR